VTTAYLRLISNTLICLPLTEALHLLTANSTWMIRNSWGGYKLTFWKFFLRCIECQRGLATRKVSVRLSVGQTRDLRYSIVIYLFVKRTCVLKLILCYLNIGDNWCARLNGSAFRNVICAVSDVRCTLFALIFLPKIAHAAARFVCDSWPTCFAGAATHTLKSLSPIILLPLSLKTKASNKGGDIGLLASKKLDDDP